MSLPGSSKTALFGCFIAFAFFNSACVSQTVIYENNFDDDPTGRYSIANLNADWNTPPFDNGVEEGRASIDDSSEAFAGKSLAVEYPAGMHWRTDGSQSSPLDSDRANITQYLYHPDQPNTFGEDFRWDDSDSGQWELFESGRWYHLRHRVVINSVVDGVGQHDGIVQAWLDDTLVLDINNIRFRDVETFAIDGFYFSTFFGGSGDQWNTSKDEVAFFDDFRISIPSQLLLGDVNRDGAVNFLDISPFITVLSVGGFQEEADIDQNTTVDFLDIGPFVSLLSTQ